MERQRDLVSKQSRGSPGLLGPRVSTALDAIDERNLDLDGTVFPLDAQYKRRADAI